MASEPERLNYFNYFTEIEEHFQRARGTALFLLSPLDWALIETWKNAGIPLEAVLRGIDKGFEQHNKKRRKTNVNSLAFCAQPVIEEAEILAGTAQPRRESPAPFPADDLRAYLLTNARATAAYPDIAASLESLAASADQHLNNLESLEQRLVAMEEKLIATIRAQLTEAQLLDIRRDLDNYLKPYRGKMTAPHLSMLERQFLDQRIFERSALPRLSIFYMR